MQNNNNLNGSFIPTIIYNNAEIDKNRILKDIKNKSGIYQWTHLESGKTYIGSAVNLSKRVSKYFTIKFITRYKKSHINNALSLYSYSAFSFSIVEYINIENLSKAESRKLILEREQYYINTLEPEFNILKIAGSSLGYKHTEESLEKLRIPRTEEAKLNISLALRGDKNPNFGKAKTEEHKEKLSQANKGRHKGENHPLFGKNHSDEAKIRMSIAKGTPIYVYDIADKTLLVNEFTSAKKAGEFFNVGKDTILRYTKNGKLFKGKWILLTEINKE